MLMKEQEHALLAGVQLVLEILFVTDGAEAVKEWRVVDDRRWHQPKSVFSRWYMGRPQPRWVDRIVRSFQRVALVLPQSFQLRSQLCSQRSSAASIARSDQLVRHE